ncbi:hypothetical protein TRIATDRAFT_300944 [Trichoderma atroviride IMI 206040]|uniref:Uncharacterized protein n=1 Tax=Hypocrea atroviridis (strain ATCC 20476 / IMI 206040) TaxID=452589 RepID=G9P3H7_HYPAI|nr:uncharacterized protein TRIATDRAFT_300944 [Trichoderma atroviride IMI 206040]EHK42935.1 hypothetical protein TRIATDRAFT_300944 [Trichoderma atroviride IMI 206040]
MIHPKSVRCSPLSTPMSNPLIFPISLPSIHPNSQPQFPSQCPTQPLPITLHGSHPALQSQSNPVFQDAEGPTRDLIYATLHIKQKESVSEKNTVARAAVSLKFPSFIARLCCLS